VLNLICTRLTLSFEDSPELQSNWPRIFVSQNLPKKFRLWVARYTMFKPTGRPIFVLPTGPIFLAAIIYDPHSWSSIAKGKQLLWGNAPCRLHNWCGPARTSVQFFLLPSNRESGSLIQWDNGNWKKWEMIWNLKGNNSFVFLFDNNYICKLYILLMCINR